MYPTGPRVSAPVNGIGNEMTDGSGTINPAALNSSGTGPVHLPLLHPSLRSPSLRSASLT